MQFFVARFNVLFQTLDQLCGLFNLSLQLFLLRPKLLLLGFQFRLLGLILGLDPLRIGACFDVVLVELRVALHDVAGVVQHRQQIAEAGGVHQQRQEPELAVFLHGAHPGAVALQLPGLKGLGLFQADRLLCDHLIVEGDFFFDGLNFLARQGIAFVHSLFARKDTGLFLFKLVYFRLLLVVLHRNGETLSAQLVNLLLRDGVGLAGSKTENDRRKQEGRDGTGYGFEIHDLCCPFSSPNRSSHCKTARDQCDCR